MNWSGPSRVAFETSSWVTRLVVLQVTGLGLSLAGGIVLGVFPAWFALLVAAQRELRGQAATAREMWSIFRQHFWRANAFGYATTTLVGSGVAQVVIGPDHGALGPLLAVVAPVTTFWVSYWSLNAWLILADRETLRLHDVIGTCLPILLQPLRSLSVMLVTAIVLFVMFRFPAVAITVGFSGLATALMITRSPPWPQKAGVSG